MGVVINQDYKNSIQQYAQQRSINSLLHFTRIENLEAILKAGIIPRATLQQNSAVNIVNDSMRLDRHLDASCISITFPNYKMFYRLRSEEETRDEDWVVIGISPEVLWEKDCAFCYSNAATSAIATSNIETFKNRQAFENMFSEFTGKPARTQMGLLINETTDPQAEVLVFDIIEPEYFQGIACYNETVKNKLVEKYENEFYFAEGSGLFSYRDDYEFWR